MEVHNINEFECSPNGGIDRQGKNIYSVSNGNLTF